MTPQDEILRLLARTMCFVIVATTLSMAFYGPERVPDSGRAFLYDVVKVTLGALIGASITKKK